MSATIGNPYGNSPYGQQSPQMMMAQRLMDAQPAPTANSSAESAGANTLSQGMRGALAGMVQPQWDEASQKYVQNSSLQQAGDWLKNLFGGGAGAPGSPFDAAMGGL
jgi:hypothetical protein